MLFFQNISPESKKLFWVWFLWTTTGIIFIVLFYPFFQSSVWSSLIGLIIFSLLLTPPLSILFKVIFEKLRLGENKRIILFLILLTTFFFLFYTSFSIHKHNNFFTGYDLAIFDQTVWHLSNFELPESSLRNVPIIFGDHFYPIIVFLTPFYWIFKDPRTLLFLQILIVVSPIFILYRWAREWRINNFHLLILSLFYFTSPVLQAIANFDFHEVVFLPLFLMGAFYFLVKRRWLFYFLFIVLLFFTKEDLALLVGIIGIFIILKERLYQIGLATFGSGLLAFFIITNFLMPIFRNSSEPSIYFQLYPGFEKGVGSGVMYYLTHPLQLAILLFTFPEKWWTVAFFLVPLLIPFLLIPQAVLLFFPLVAQKVLSSYRYLSFLGVPQYNIAFLPFGVITLLYFLNEWKKSQFLQRIQQKIYIRKLSIPTLVVVFPLIINLIFSFQFGYLFRFQKEWAFVEASTSKEELESLINVVPADVSVSASHIFLPHMSQRDKIYMLPQIRDAQFIIFHYCYKKPCNLWPMRPEDIPRLYQYFKNHPADFKLKAENYSGAVFERIGVYNESLKKELTQVCKILVKNAELEPIHISIFLESCEK